MIPIHVLTGFLGAGKTTLLARLLQAPRGERLAALVNDAGALALDGDLVERVDDDVLALPNGCLCCTLDGALDAALRRLLARRPERIVVETSGIADPAPILHALATDPLLAGSLSLASVVTVVDGTRVESLLEEHPEVRRQIELGDRVVVTHGDLAPERVAEATALVAAEAGGREVREATPDQVDLEWLLAPAPLARIQDERGAGAWLHHGNHGALVRAHSVRLEQAASVELVQLWLRLVTQFDGDRLLRVKALVECNATGDLFALQSAGHAVSPPRRLARRPDDVTGVRVVLIERGLPEGVLERMRSALGEAAAGSIRRMRPAAEAAPE